MKIIDTHAHYDDRWFDEDRYEVLDRILSDNVLAIINMSVDIPTCEFSLKLTERYENVFCACLLYTSPSPRDRQKSRMPSSA